MLNRGIKAINGLRSFPRKKCIGIELQSKPKGSEHDKPHRGEN